MAAPLGSGDDSIFEQLRKKQDATVVEGKARATQAEEHAWYEKAQRRLGELVESNSTLPCTISSIHVLGASNTRPVFLKRIFNPLLSANKNHPYTLSGAISEVSHEINKLHKFDIYYQPIPLSIARPDPTNPSTTPTDIDIYLSLREKSRLILKTGTDVGNAEGSAYVNALGRNIFGGAETLNLNAALGTRTRSAYQASFETPILSNPDLRWEFGGLASSTQKPWASHEEVLKGGWTKIKWTTGGGERHELMYNGVWRQITGLAGDASATVRGDAGDSVKSSISHCWAKDRRDSPLLPTRGYFNKTTLELAGWGPLQGDVAFGKAEVEAQGAVPVPIPGITGKSGVSFTTGLRAGLLYPLPLGLNSESNPSHINDRFQLGGPTDVRGFRLSGLGPHDGKDAVGGDVYAAGSANLLLPIPRVDIDKPFRFQAFVNGGRLLALKQRGTEGKDSQKVRQTILSTLAELGNGLPSMSAGFGLVYAAPMARVEINFSLPLVLRRGEEGRKGLSFGIGINML
ncbi:MAG: hypothetical protein Q9217_001440 [Psora testacea]